MNVVFGNEKIKHLKNCNLSPNWLKLINSEVIVQNDELHKILDYFLSWLNPFNEQQDHLDSEYGCKSTLYLYFVKKNLPAQRRRRQE